MFPIPRHARRLALAALILVLLPTAALARLVEQVGALVEARLAADALEVDGVALDGERLRRLYQADVPFWIGADGPGARLRALIGVLGAAEREGLRPEAYRVRHLEAALEARAPEALAGLELLASDALIRYLDHLRNGRVRPNAAQPETFPPDPPEDVLPRAKRVALDSDPARALAEAAPANPDYRRLRRALSAYRDIAARGGWPSLPDGPTLHQGARDPRVATLRKRLMATGDLTIAVAEPERFDAGLDLAVRRFQRRHGLTVDGLVGPMTRAALNVPVERRLRQILVNMERWRWMPDDLGRRYVKVNLAGFELEVVEDGRMIMDMRVIVGRTYRRTPVFSDRIRYLEVNPYWNIPPSIARADIRPKVLANPNYLREQGIRVLSDWSHEAVEVHPSQIDWANVNLDRLKLRQDPGPLNALGRVKFMFPNRFNVYLHDTPATELFHRAVRTFSSGCIRVERPLQLAAYLLGGTPLGTVEAIRAEIETGRTRAIPLPEAVNVHLVYATAWMGEGGVIHFRDDAYERDAVLAEALFAEPSARAAG